MYHIESIELQYVSYREGGVLFQSNKASWHTNFNIDLILWLDYEVFLIWMWLFTNLTLTMIGTSAIFFSTVSWTRPFNFHSMLMLRPPQYEIPLSRHWKNYHNVLQYTWGWIPVPVINMIPKTCFKITSKILFHFIPISVAGIYLSINL
jgi:hypothetical protein